MTMTHHNTILLVVLYGLIWMERVCARQPHILFIVADDYGWNDIGYHGSDIPTPNLDALAAKGVKLDNYYVQPVCTPSRAAVMSGRYPIRYGLQHDVIFPPQASGLHLNETTLPEILRHAGYQTHAVGKWHLGFFEWDYTPLYRGFDSFFGYYLGAEDYFNHSRTEVNMTGYDFRLDNEVYKEVIGEYSTNVFEGRVQRIVANYTATNSSEPLFIYMAFQACHAPIEPPTTDLENNCTHINDSMRRAFCEMAVAMDTAVGNITQAFKQAGIWDDTIMIFTTDNGGLPTASGNNYPLRGGKFTLYEGGVRGVSFVHSALLPNPGETKDNMMHIVDWLPTIAHLASADVNVPGKPVLPLDGFNMWEAITQNVASPRSQILHNIDPMDNTSAVRLGEWKLIQGKQPYNGWYPPPTVSLQTIPTANETYIYLFNVTADPNERTNLAATHPDVVTKLQALIQTYADGMVAPWYPKFDSNANPNLHGGSWGPWINN